MKAQRVYENIEFERGKDPKKAMGLGIKPEDIAHILETLYMSEVPVSDVSHLLDREGDAIIIEWNWYQWPNSKRPFRKFRNTISEKLGPFISNIEVEDQGDGPFYVATIKKSFEDLFMTGFELARFYK